MGVASWLALALLAAAPEADAESTELATPAADDEPAADATPTTESEPTTTTHDSPQAAPRTRVGVLPLVIVGDVAPEVGDAADRLSQEVHTTLAQADYDAVLLEADQAGDAETPYCGDPVCWQRFAKEHHVTHFLVVVVRFSEPDYEVSARLVDGRTGADVGDDHKSCDLCGITELGEVVHDVASRMRREVEATMVLPPTLAVTSSPTGARVKVDGEEVGVTPLVLTSVTGRHRVEVRMQDFVSEQVDVELVDGVRRDVEVSLRRRPPPEPVIDEIPVQRPNAGAFLGTGAAALAAGVGMIAGGAVMIAIHDHPIRSDCTGDNMDPLGRCRFLYDTRGGGIGLTVGGVLVAGVGVALTIIGAERRKPKASRLSSRLQIRANGFGIAGRF